MSLVLKKDLELPEDVLITDTIYNVFDNRDKSAFFRPPIGLKMEGPNNFTMRRGSILPEGPLHPLHALAFGMARFVLKCAKRGLLYTATPEGRWRFVHRLPNGRYEVDPGDGTPPFDAVIVGHQDPEVL